MERSAKELCSTPAARRQEGCVAKRTNFDAAIRRSYNGESMSGLATESLAP